MLIVTEIDLSKNIIKEHPIVVFRRKSPELRILRFKEERNRSIRETFLSRFDGSRVVTCAFMCKSGIKYEYQVSTKSRFESSTYEKGRKVSGRRRT